MTPLQAQLPSLKKRCAAFLAANGKKPTTKGGAALVHAFYLGALTALGEDTNPYVTVCLLSGRHSELCDFSEIQR